MGTPSASCQCCFVGHHILVIKLREFMMNFIMFPGKFTRQWATTSHLKMIRCKPDIKKDKGDFPVSHVRFRGQFQGENLGIKKNFPGQNANNSFWDWIGLKRGQTQGGSEPFDPHGSRKSIVKSVTSQPRSGKYNIPLHASHTSRRAVV